MVVGGDMAQVPCLLPLAVQLVSFHTRLLVKIQVRALREKGRKENDKTRTPNNDTKTRKEHNKDNKQQGQREKRS